MRPFTTHDAAAGADRVREGAAARLRLAAALAWLAMTPGFAFARQRSNFIQGWEAAARAAQPLTRGASAGAIGELGVPALGSWMMLPDLTSPATQTVLPMNDSLYGAAHLELDRQGPVVISVPPDPDGRYYSVSVMDAHFNNAVHLGPRWTGRGAVEVLLVPPGWDGAAPNGIRVVEAPTVSVCLLNRILVRYEPGDLDRVRQWRQDFTIRPLAGELVDVAHDDLVHPEAEGLADPWRFFEIGFAHLRRNPLPAEASWAIGMATEAELLGAREEGWSRRAVEAGVAEAQAMVDATLTTWPRRNGWMLSFPWMGLPNPHVLETAALELFEVGLNDLAEATYFFGDVDAEGQPLDGSDGAAYRLTFPADSLPPIHDEGFWSLTMYGSDSLLVDNAIDRYSTRVTRPGLRLDPDGAVTFVLSEGLPEGVDEANWLPAPAGPFRLGLRLYHPRQEVLDGVWTPPAPVSLDRAST